MSIPLRIAALAALVATSASIAQDRPPLERYVPGDAAIVLSFRDLPGVWARMQGLSFIKAGKDPAFKPFVDSVKRELTGAFEAAGSAGGIEFDKLAEIVRGQVLIAVRIATDADGKTKPELQVLADVQGKEELVRSVLDRAVNKAVQDGKASKRIVGDVTILTPSKTEDAEKNRFCYAMKAGLLVGGDNAEARARTVQGLPGGPTNPLLQNATLTRFRRAFAKHAKGLGDIEIYILNAKALTDAAKNDLDGPPPSAASQSVDSMGFSVCAARGDFETLVQMMVVPRAEMKIGSDNTMPGRTLPADPWAPDNASAYLSFNLDIDKIYAQLVKQLETTMPGGFQRIEDQLKEFPDRANPLITNIKKDIIEPLGDRISLVLDRGEFQGRNQLRLMLGWKLRDSDRISRLMSGLIAQAGPLVTEKQVKGFNVYVFPPLPPPPAIPGKKGGKASEPTLWVGNSAVAVTKSHLYATTHVEMIDRTLNYQGQPGLSEHAPATKVLAKAPEAPSAVLYVKPEEFGRLLYSAVASEALQKQVLAMASGIPRIKEAIPNLSAAINEDKLPPFDEVKKYFVAPAGGYVTVEEGAVRVAVFSLK
jgi:hypothetical protein